MNTHPSSWRWRQVSCSCTRSFPAARIGLFCLQARAVDPDPHESVPVLIFTPGGKKCEIITEKMQGNWY